MRLDPDLHQAREPLAALLAHVPDRWLDAIRHHQALLAENPTRTGSLRALLEISRRRDCPQACDLGLALMTDSDQSCSRAQAWYADFRLLGPLQEGVKPIEPPSP